MVSDDFEGTNRCCELALKLMDAFKCKELTARTYASVYGFLNCYKNPIRESIRHLHDAYRLNILTGDVEVRVRCESLTYRRCDKTTWKNLTLFLVLSFDSN